MLSRGGGLVGPGRSADDLAERLAEDGCCLMLLGPPVGDGTWLVGAAATELPMAVMDAPLDHLARATIAWWNRASARAAVTA